MGVKNMVIAWTLQTGFGAWNPAAWLVAFLVALGIALRLRARGRKDYRRGTGQDLPFISGNQEPDNEQLHIRAGHVYWGFLESMRRYYDRLLPLHTGDATDYLLWMLGMLALVLIVGWLA